MSTPNTGSYASDRVAVVVNGNAKQVTDDLVEILDQIVQSGDLFVSRSLEEGKDIAKRIVARGYPTVLTGGGDGTFTQMVTWITREADAKGVEAPRFGLLRLGTGNAIAWVLGAQKLRGGGVFADLGRLRQQGGSRELRLVEVEGQLTPFAGVGVDAMALADYNRVKAAFERTPGLAKMKGGLAYLVSIAGVSMPKVLFRPQDRVRITNLGADALRIGVDGQPVGPPVPEGGLLYDGPCRAVLMSTIPYWGFGARIFPFADEREDRFNIRVVDIGSVDVAWNIRSIWKGTYRDDRIHDFLAERVKLSFERPLDLQIGGDAAGEFQEFEAKLSRSIRVVDYYAPPPVE